MWFFFCKELSAFPLHLWRLIFFPSFFNLGLRFGFHPMCMELFCIVFWSFFSSKVFFGETSGQDSELSQLGHSLLRFFCQVHKGNYARSSSKLVLSSANSLSCLWKSALWKNLWGKIHQLINFQQWEAVFRTSSVEACEIHTYSPFVSLFLYHDRVG